MLQPCKIQIRDETPSRPHLSNLSHYFGFNTTELKSVQRFLLCNFCFVCISSNRSSFIFHNKDKFSIFETFSGNFWYKLRKSCFWFQLRYPHVSVSKIYSRINLRKFKFGFQETWPACLCSTTSQSTSSQASPTSSNAFQSSTSFSW